MEKMRRFLIYFENLDNTLVYPERFTYAKNILDAITNLYQEEYLNKEGYTVDRITKIIEETNE